MNEKPLLSVVVPIYNTKNYLKECLDSIINQTYPNIEIILVDDCSTDGSSDICDEYLNGFKDIICIHKKENQGLACARRDGLLSASGEYIGFVDSDDWIEPSMYDEMMSHVIDDGAQIVSCDAYRELENNSNRIENDPIESGLYFGERIKWVKENIVYYKKYRTGLVTVSVPLKVYKKELLQTCITNIPPHMTHWEDLTYVFNPYFNANKIYVTRKVFYHIRYRKGSMSRNIDENTFREIERNLKVAQTIFKPYGQQIENTFYQKATQIIAEYVSDILSYYNDKKNIKEKWEEVSKSKKVKEYYIKCNPRNDDFLLKMVLKRKYDLAFLYLGFIRFEKPLENRIKTFLRYKK